MLDALPDRLLARSRRLSPRSIGDGPVVYWMRTAVRAHENAALDVALTLAKAYGRPLFVYQAISERYPYASDRHHRFLLEGARDVARQLAERGIAHALHVERPGHRGRHLDTLARRSALLVTEDLPVAPLREWTRALAERIPIPLLAVDTATVVPMRTIGSGIDRAYAYRKAMARHLPAALEAWPEVDVGRSELPSLPFTPIDPETVDLDSLIASCSIDHTVPPVLDTPGGSTAGYARWEAFRASGLADYAAQRNDPVLHGTSRLSPYLHLGMVAPTRIAREAHARGAEKFLDELLVWRELAHTWCLYARHHHDLRAVPAWARETLQAHAGDRRSFLPHTDQLEAGTTGSLLWDLAQQSLTRHGELHNNVRMTWGKALLAWSPSPEVALQRLIDLNHRYALDGRDPASYGGLLWCLGLFDRPFPESAVLGTVRSRSVVRHAKRVDLDAYGQHVHRGPRLRVGIVGAGLAGSFLGRLLADQGVEVTLFDKARGAGGRLSVRRREPERFALGGRHLDVRDPRLERFLTAWAERDLCRRHGERWELPVPNALLKHLQRGLDVRFGRRVQGVRHDGDWTIELPDGDSAFDVVVVTAPAPQAAELLGEHGFAAQLATVRMQPTWVVLWSNDTDNGTFHFDTTWSQDHLEAGKGTVLAAAAEHLPGKTPLDAHRWRFARTETPLDDDVLHDTSGLVVAGDAFAGGDTQGALLSAMAAFGRVMTHRRTLA